MCYNEKDGINLFSFSMKNTDYNLDNMPDNSFHNKKRGYVRSKARVFFVRHGKTGEATREKDSIPQSKEAFLDNRGIRQMKAAGIYLKIAGIKYWVSKIMYGDDTTRSIKSVEIIANEIIDGNKIKKCKTAKLRTTQKGLTDEERIIENGKVFIATVELMKQIRKGLNNSLVKENGFILIGHKSNKSGILEAADNVDNNLEISFDIENGEILERDIDEVTGEYIDPKKNPETLFLNRGNYKEILKTMIKIPEFKASIVMFEANTQNYGKKYPIWELQNDLNTFIHRNTRIFSQLLQMRPSSIYLRVFCLTNLILGKEYDEIGTCYPLLGYISLSKEEKKVLLQSSKDPKIMGLFRRLFLYRNNLWDSGDELLIKEYLTIKTYEELKRDQLIFQKATIIQTRSLDDEIKTGSSNAIIEQRIKIKDNEMEMAISNDAIIQSKDSYTLPAMVGSGKSIWTTNLVKRIIINYPEKRVVFFEGIDWNNSTIEKICDELETNLQDRKNSILIIDAFDEIGSDQEMKRKLLDRLKKEWSDIKIIITGRQSEFHETNNAPFKSLKLSFNKHAFIEQKGGKYKAEIKELLDKNFTQGDALENPLLVFFICELANNAERYGNLGILPLQEIIKISIQTNKSIKALLYVNIVKLILVKHEQTKLINSRKFGVNEEENNKRFQYIFETLSQLAMSMVHNESYESILKKYNWNEIDKSDFFDTVNILFKKDEDSNYQFALKSLHEYFVFHYRENIISKNRKNKYQWKKILDKSQGDILLEILTSTGYMDFEGFKEDIYYLLGKQNKNILIIILESIGLVGNPEGLELLEKIMDLDAFKNSSEAIDYFCWAIGQTKDPRSMPHLEKIMDLDAFKNSSEAIESFCITIGHINSAKGLIHLREILTLATSKTNEVCIGSICWAIGNIKDPRGLNLLENIIHLDVFKKDSETIGWFFWSIREILKPEACKLILEEIEEIIMHIPKAFYNMAYTYAYSNLEHKSMEYLEMDLAYQQKQGVKELQNRLNDINKHSWYELKPTIGFQAVIWKYNRILQELV